MLKNQYLHKIFKASVSPAVILFPDAPHFTIVDLNSNLAILSGQRETDLIGKGFFELFPYKPETENDNLNLLQSLKIVADTKTAHKISSHPIDFRHKISGQIEKRFFDAEHTPLMSENGDLEYIFTSFTEVSQITVSQNQQRPPGAKSQFQLSDESFKSLIYGGSDLIGVIDKEANYVYMSPSSLSILGIPSEELIGKNAVEFLHPDEIEVVFSNFSKLQSSGSLKIAPFRFRHKNGAWRWLETVVSDHSDNPYVKGIIVNSRDITSRIHAEEKLKKSEEKYKILFRLSPLPKWVYDLETLEILDVNETAINHYGYSREEFLKLTVKDIRPKEEIVKFLQIRENLKNHEGLINLGLFVHLKKNKTKIKVEVSGFKFLNQERICMMTVCVDVTEREDALQQLKDNEAKYITAQKIARLGYWQLDLESRSLFWSDEVYNIVGRNKETFKVSIESFFEIIHPEDKEDFLKEQSKALTGINEFVFEYRILMPDGSLKWINEKGKLVKNDQGEPVIFEGSIQDTTAEKQLELSLAESNQRYQYVSQATSDAIWDLNLETGYIFWGEGFGTIFSYNLETVTSDISFWSKKIHPEDRDKVFNGINEAAKGNDLKWTEEYRFLKGDNTYAYVSDKGFFIRDKKGTAKRMVGAMQDITERKKAETELLQFKKVIEDSQNGIALSDTTGRNIYMNPSFMKMLEYDHDTLQNANSPHLIYTNKLLAKEVFNNLLLGKHWKGDIELLKKGGKKLDYYLSGGPIFNDRGELIAIYGIHTDISERKKTEHALQAAYNERNDILESIGDAFFAVDKNWIVTYWNKKAEKVLGRTKCEAVGKNLYELYQNLPKTIYNHYFQKALEENTEQHFEGHVGFSNKWLDINAFPSNNGLSVYLKDITEQKQAIEKIRQSNERFERISEATNDAIWDIDLITNNLYLGDGFRKLWGENYDKEVHGVDSWLNHVHPDDRPIVGERLKEALNNKNMASLEGEYRYARANGTYAHVIAHVAIIRDNKGIATRLVGAFTDMTQQKAYEKSLKKLNEDLAKSNRQLASTNKELEQFAYIASHDLQEPLRMVTGFLTQIEKKYSDIIDEKGKKYIYFAVDGAKRMRQIILDLLEFSRVGRLAEKPELVDLNDLINEIIILFRNQIKETSAIINFDNLPKLQTYKTPFLQILQNLIANCLKYHHVENPRIHISAEEMTDHWQFSVKDNGIGINPEYFDRIFVVFQRLHNKDEYSGSGIGLAIVKKIVESLGGEIWVESEEGKGSNFIFTIKK